MRLSLETNSLRGADALVHTREVIYNIAAKHGLACHFRTTNIHERCRKVQHTTNISVHSVMSRKIISNYQTVEKSFLAGIMIHLPSLPALTLPIPASYKRVKDGVWSGGTYVCWGMENRESPVRLTNLASPSSRRFEMCFVDSTANPHLVLAGILSAGYLEYG